MPNRTAGLAESAENLGKLILAGLGLLFAIGTIIVNVQLGEFGLNDFSSLRPRFVLVGLAFLIYTAIPPAVCVSLLWTGKRVGFNRHPTRAVAVIMLVAITVLLLVPSLFRYFIPYIIFQRLGVLAGTRAFWMLYINPYGTLVEAGLICLPTAILFLRRNSEPSTRRWAAAVRRASPDRMLVAAIFLGCLGMVHPYATITSFNISKAVGGGHPSIVLFMVDEAIGHELDRASPSRNGPSSYTEHGPFLMWHETEDRTFVTEAAEGRWMPVPVILSIANESIRVTRYVPGAVRLESHSFGKLEMTVYIQPIH